MFKILIAAYEPGGKLLEVTIVDDEFATMEIAEDKIQYLAVLHPDCMVLQCTDPACPCDKLKTWYGANDGKEYAVRIS